MDRGGRTGKDTTAYRGDGDCRATVRTTAVKRSELQVAGGLRGMNRAMGEGGASRVVRRLRGEGGVF